MSKVIARSHTFHILAIILFSFFAYSNIFGVPFVFDDLYNIVNNSKIRSLANIPTLFTHINGPIGSRPLTIATLAVNFAVGGLNPLGYHMFSLVIHTLNGLLLYVLIFETAKAVRPDMEYADRLSAFVAVVFVLHPIQTEAVAYAISRSMLLATLFFLSGLLLFLKASSSDKPAPYAIALFVVSLSGMASREDFVTFPVMLLLYDYVFVSGMEARNVIGRWRLHLPAFLSLAYLFFLVYNFDYGKSAGSKVRDVAPLEFLMTQFRVHMTYLRLLILPYRQSIDYDYAISKSLMEPATFFSFIGYSALWISGFYMLYKKRIHGFFVLWFMITLTPSGSVVPLTDVIFEHRLYLPSIGILTLFGVGIFGLMQERKNENTANIRAV